ncbi:MAG: beta-aspartyl-peptidase [Spirochaetes bacterium]|nr:beta-aspartyl-peptidase [Spirochaetota bacterium]MBU0956656.1 beta-aspartyl-peptidase [Spirochaetota bacterium]
MLLIKNVLVYDPAPAGLCDILIAGGRIEAVAAGLAASLPPGLCKIIEGEGLTAVPGFIDAHVHITGGGGEGGFRTRTPELTLGGAIRHGVTTVIGVLGTDGVTRSLPALVAKVYALREEGLSAWCYTGSYHVPVPTLTGDIMKDIMLIDPVIGVGEVALSDHRSSQPTQAELARLSSDARVAGMLSGKAGVVNLHLGDAPAGMRMLRELCASSELPFDQFIPTHCNRNLQLFAEALDWLRIGGNVDFTASSNESILEDGELSAAAALFQVHAAGLSLERVSITSDGQGSLPVFDSQGRLSGLDVGNCGSLFAALREAVQQFGLPLESVLPVLSANPARMLKLAGKGRLQAGMDADLLLLDQDLQLRSVMAGGRLMLHNGAQLVRGTFES